jgi:hypothetical protein
MDYRFVCFGRDCRIHLQENGNIAWELAASSSGKLKTLFCPEDGGSRFLRKLCELTPDTIWHHISEYSAILGHRRDNLQCYTPVVEYN